MSQKRERSAEVTTLSDDDIQEVVASSSPAKKATKTDVTAGTSFQTAQTAVQEIVLKGEVQTIKNSPYAAQRGSLGWGTPFQAAPSCTVKECPRVHIGMSSLNGVPGKQREMEKLMAQYVKKFHCMEHCNPYHRFPDADSVRKWKAMAPPGFVFTVKANQYITHKRMLQIDEESTKYIGDFCASVAGLGRCLGPILMQMPPQFHKNETNLGRVKALMNVVPSNVRIAMEFRHSSWFCEETYALLREAKWCCVATHNHDVGDSPVVDTGSGFLYFRLHGPLVKYGGDYGAVAMKRYAERVVAFVSANDTNEVFFMLNNNETSAANATSSTVDATQLAKHIRELLTQSPS